jgi:alkylation response protein AidB-like acyl-CoA dehydrogenase
MKQSTDDDLLSDLRDSAHRFLARAASAGIGEVSQAVPEWWSDAVSMGWLGLVAPEWAGGADAGAAAAAAIVEEFAYYEVATPYVASAVLATRALSTRGESSLAERWLPEMVAGKATAAVAATGVNGLVHRAAIGPRLTDGFGGAVSLTGSSHYVSDAAFADLFLIASLDSRGELAVVGVERTQRGVGVVPLRTHDRSHRLGHIVLEQVNCPREAVLARGSAAEALFAAVSREGVFALAADSLGTARRAFDLALDYAKERNQFGRPIGSFQAIKHKLADMYVLLTGSAALLYHGASAVDSGDDDLALVSVGSYVREAASRIAGDSMQIHGAHGYTWEHPCHRLLKRAKFNERYLSTLWAERDRLACLHLQAAMEEN